MTYIRDVHDYSDTRHEPAHQWLSKRNMDEIKRQICEMIDFERNEMIAEIDFHVSQVAAERAEKFLVRVLQGDAKAAEALFGAGDVSRYRQSGTDIGEPWARLIYGELSETESMTLRRQIVEAHRDLITSERIADLESIVAGLTAQIGRLEAELNRCR